MNLDITRNVEKRIGDMAQNEVGTLGGARYSEGRDEPWCGDFATWCLRKVGLGDLGSPSVPQIERHAKDRGLWHSAASGYRPKRGDLITFNWGRDGVADHIGIITGMNSDGSIQVVAGNSNGYGRTGGQSITSGAVVLHNFSLASPAVRGFVSLSQGNPSASTANRRQASKGQITSATRNEWRMDLELQNRVSALLNQLLQSAENSLNEQFSSIENLFNKELNQGFDF